MDFGIAHAPGDPRLTHTGVMGTRAHLDQALHDKERLLRDQLDALGSDHPDTLATRHELACPCGETGATVAAVTELEQPWHDRERILGAAHPDTTSTTELEHALTILERVLGPDDPMALARNIRR